MRRQFTVLTPSLVAVLSTCTSMQAQSSETRSEQEPASAVVAAPIASVERSGDGKPVCGLGRSFHAGRRKALRETLGNGVVVIRGLPDVRDYMQFRQDKVFWYLTGVESPNAALVMDCASGREVLLLPDANHRRERWDGELWDADDAWVRDLTGIGDVRPSAKLDDVLHDFIKNDSKIWISMHPNAALAGCCDQAYDTDKSILDDPFDGRASREQALATALERTFHTKPSDCSQQIGELRRVKQPEEIAAMRRAGRAGALAMAEAIRSTSAGLGEWELDGLMSWIHLRAGAAGPAYHAIVGSGANSLVLHYGASNRRMNDGEVVLIDYAPEVDHYTSDITRTWPVNGRFSARQAELYAAVLESQAAGIAAVKPGATIEDVSKACAKVFEQKGLGKLERHGPCHYIGLEVHDDADYSTPFVAGVCFTVEPGLYEESTGIGIRIEDVVCVTAEGCEVLSRDVPKDRAAMEQLVGEQGVLDWLGARVR
jgi:Xaa-Pro aminopeptidase